MAGHLVVSSYEYALVIAAYRLFAYGTVKENYRNVLSACLLNNVLSRIVGTAVYQIYYQQGSSLGNGRGNLLGLCGLAVVAVVILISDPC